MIFHRFFLCLFVLLVSNLNQALWVLFFSYINVLLEYMVCFGFIIMPYNYSHVLLFRKKKKFVREAFSVGENMPQIGTCYRHRYQAKWCVNPTGFTQEQNTDFPNVRLLTDQIEV